MVFLFSCSRCSPVEAHLYCGLLIGILTSVSQEMASFYPTSGAQIDVLSTPCIEDQKFTTFSEAPILHGNMMMYLNPSSSAGSISETSIAAQNNCVDIPSVTGRNEVMFIPPTGDSMCIQAISGQLNTATTDAVPNSVPEELHMTSRSQLSMVDGEQNLHGLSLSLSTQMSNTVPAPSFQHRFSNPPGLSPVLNCHVSLSGENSCRSLSDKVEDGSHSKDTAYGSYDLYGEGANSVRFGTPNNLLFSANPKGVGYSSYQYEQVGMASTILKSKYLRAAQMLLDEVVNVRDALKQHESAKDQNNINKVEDGSSELKEKSVPGSEANESATSSAPELSPTERQDLQNKLDKLLAMLDEVDRRYKQYYHQMQILVSSFDLVAGSGAAKPYTTLALKTISRHFRCLRDAISEQIQATRKSLGEVDSGQGGVIPRLRYIDQQLRQQRALQQFGMMRHAWRPQRGLPENAVTVLRAWLFEHFLHPYPKDSEKIMLARQTGLTRSQVANWFINARVRLWKPMVEEMYKEEFSKGDLPNPKSPDNMTRALGERSWASEDRRENLQESISSMADDSRHIQEDPHTGRAGMIGPAGGEEKQRRMLMKLQQDHHQPSLDGHGYYPHDNGLMVAASAYQFPAGMGSYGVDNQVSLALGLRHMEEEVGPLSSAGAAFRESESVENGMVPGTTGYSSYIDSVNQQQHRFGNSHLLNDFVA